MADVHDKITRSYIMSRIRGRDAMAETEETHDLPEEEPEQAEEEADEGEEEQGGALIGGGFTREKTGMPYQSVRGMGFARYRLMFCEKISGGWGVWG